MEKNFNPNRDKRKVITMSDIVKLAVADGVLTPKERALLEGMAHGLGIDSCELDRLIQSELHKTQSNAEPD